MWIRTVFLILLTPLVWATSPMESYNRVHLSVSASSELENNQLTVRLVARAEAKTAAKAAAKVNEKMQWALSKLDSEQNIASKTLNYRTFPKYNHQEISGWQGEQGLELESSKIETLTAITSELQGGLDVVNMKYHSSTQARRLEENRLIEEAIVAFNQRADLIRKQLGAKNFHIVKLQIDSQDRYQNLPRSATMSARTTAAEQDTQTAVRAGTQTVIVNINGEIELE